MKRLFYLFVMTLLIITACNNDDDDIPLGDTKTKYVDASLKNTWHYFSFKKGEVIGTGEENDVDNKKWFERADWDIAICRYTVRTNSGEATSVESEGGVYICSEQIVYEKLTEIPRDVDFENDKVVTVSSHGQTKEIVKSKAQVIQLKKDAQGKSIMPPVYLPSPVYLFKSADGKEIYKVNFKEYMDADGNSGYVKFDYAILY